MLPLVSVNNGIIRHEMAYLDSFSIKSFNVVLRKPLTL
jgi:hypothetical protein